MSTAQSVKLALETALAQANAKTGENDTTITDAIGSLIAGFGQSGGAAPATVSLKDINFYDYDGTIVASWTLAELASATELPPNLAHAGLISQGWNWNLADLKTTNRAVNVGQMYITDDGKTRLYIRIATLGRMDVPLCFSQTVANGVTIDWGDGSAPQTLSGTGNKNTTHTYADVGDYVITLDPAEGCVLGLGSGSSSQCVMGSTGNDGRIYCNMLQKAEIGSSVTRIGDYAFQHCYSLAQITIPDSVTSIGSNALQYCYSLAQITIPDSVTRIGSSEFRYCYSLAQITIPDSVTSIGDYAFQYCYSLAQITIPDSVTSIGSSEFRYCYSLAQITIPDSVTRIGDYALQYCYSLAQITIPDSVTSIGDYAFQHCLGMAEYHLKPTTPPSLATSSFASIPSDCIIYVPYSADHSILNAYKTATNWSALASQIQEETA